MGTGMRNAQAGLFLGVVALASSQVSAADLDTGAVAAVPAPPASSVQGYIGPFSEFGRKLNDIGIFPIAFTGEWLVANPSFGIHPGSKQWMTQVNLGFDYYFEPLTGLKGTSVHFLEGIVPNMTTATTSNSYFTQAGDVINASASAFVPLQDHLSRFTLEQDFMDGKIFTEGGKGYVNDYVARPDCLNPFMCMSVIAVTHKASGFNFPNYSNWFARAGINVTPELTVQALWYEYDNNSAYTTGWESWLPSYYPGYLADVQYASKTEVLPFAYELMYFHNNIPQTDQLCLACLKTTTNWQAGIFASAMQTFWRKDPDSPTMLQAFASLGYTFNDRQTESPSVGGLQYSYDIGLTLKAPFQSRPFDSYSIQVTAVRLTNDEQTWLTNQGYGASGPTEYSLGLSAKFKVYEYAYFSPYVEFIHNASAAFASTSFVNPTNIQPKRDGVGVGATFSVSFSDLLGLTTRPSGYTGHYP